MTKASTETADFHEPCDDRDSLYSLNDSPNGRKIT